jgi:hypothetical protein
VQVTRDLISALAWHAAYQRNRHARVWPDAAATGPGEPMPLEQVAALCRREAEAAVECWEAGETALRSARRAVETGR